MMQSAPEKSAGVSSIAVRTVLRVLPRIEGAHLVIQLPSAEALGFGSKASELQADIRVQDEAVFSRTMRFGDIGFAESFIDGQWTTSDLTALLRVLIRNRTVIDRAIYGSWWGRWLHRLRHWGKSNTKAGSRKNIHAHYDLGNDFYRLWLDETMNYSSALFSPETVTMEDAQNAKVRRCLTQAGVGAGSRVLEIGCGWGALAQMGAQSFGAHVTGITLSHEQLSFAQARLDALQLSDSVDFRLQDYRDVLDKDNEGQFDAVCSVEMIEAVGREWWPTYFSVVARALKPQGKACIQAIVMDDALFPRYLQGTDFIQQYIFPGGCLLSDKTVREQSARAGLRVVRAQAFGMDYAQTLSYWRERFMVQWEHISTLGFDLRFQRTWLFYLAYCEAGFREGNLSVVQYTMERE